MTEVEDIWDRIKKHIDIEKLKGKNQGELKDEIERQLNQINQSDTRGKSGNVQRLIKAGFPQKFAEFIKPKISKQVITIRNKEYSKQDLNIKESFWKGKKAEYISDKKTGKRITWKLIT